VGDGLSAEAIVADAVAATAIDDVGDDWFMTPLGAWSADLRRDNLTEKGRGFFRSQAVRDVSRRLRVFDTIRQHPEILDVDVPPIVHITGMERSGTTLLHNLLALHGGARALLRWELMEPVPPPTTATASSDPRIEQVQAAIEPLRGSLLERMHWVNADEPEECVWGFLDCVSFLGQSVGACMPTWGAFIRDADHTRAFEHYRQLLQLLTWKHPVPDGGFLVLKAPQVATHIEQFAAVFPEARFVVPDRDPFRCLVSVGVMVRSIVEPFCVENPVRGPIDHGEAGDVGDLFDLLGFFSAKLDSLVEFSSTSPDRVVHVSYTDVVADGVSAASSIAGALDLPHDAAWPERIEQFLAAQRAGRRAVPPRQLDTLGFDHDEVLAHPSIARYCETFGIEPERDRITG